MSEEIDIFSRTDQNDMVRTILAHAAGSSGIGEVRNEGLTRWRAGSGRLLDAGSGNGEVADQLARTFRRPR